MPNIYTHDEFVKEVHAACAKGETRRVLDLVNNSKINQHANGNPELVPTRRDFQEKLSDDGLGQTPLQVAAEKGFVDIVKILVEQLKVEVDVVDEAGWTALHWACAIRRSGGGADDSIVKILLGAGASIGVVTKDKGDTALHLAAANGHFAIVKMLVATGANVNRTNEDGATPVHVAAQRGHADIIAFFNANGADMGRRNSTGNTPLHLASASNRIDALEMLVKGNPDAVNATNAAGQTPADIAGCQTVKDIVKPFKKAVNAVRAMLRFGGLGGIKATPTPIPLTATLTTTPSPGSRGAFKIRRSSSPRNSMDGGDSRAASEAGSSTTDDDVQVASRANSDLAGNGNSSGGGSTEQFSKMTLGGMGKGSAAAAATLTSPPPLSRSKSGGERKDPRTPLSFRISESGAETAPGYISN
mmetsp:Transcript_28556/g.70373  ORF Transcript_28556/g.70373 Transcript_28556/m.70373 type:complete len:416 (+) Transcript_28556:83-1330(+)